MDIDLTGDSSDDDNLVNNIHKHHQESNSNNVRSSPAKRTSMQSEFTSKEKKEEVKKPKVASIFTSTSEASSSSSSKSKSKGKGKEIESSGSDATSSKSGSTANTSSLFSSLIPQKISSSTASTLTISNSTTTTPSRPLEYDSRWGAGFDNSDSNKVFDTSQANYWTPEIKRVFSKHYANDGGLRLDQVIVSKDSEFLIP